MEHKKPYTIFELFDSKPFRKRTEMYIGEKSISKLRLFMIGYEMCEDFNGINSKDTRPPFWLFFHWICKYYSHSGSYYNWDGIILQNCGNDESKALDTFFERFDEFRTYQPKKIISAKITDSELSFFYSHEGTRWTLRNGKRIKEKPAEVIYIVEYDKGFGSTIHHLVSEKQVYADYKLSTKDAIAEAEREYGKGLKWNQISEKELEEIDEILSGKINYFEWGKPE
ncbi:MAG: hypothetical protein AAF573_09735 [Bacteroidota bacterium]